MVTLWHKLYLEIYATCAPAIMSWNVLTWQYLKLKLRFEDILRWAVCPCPALNIRLRCKWLPWSKASAYFVPRHIGQWHSVLRYLASQHNVSQNNILHEKPSSKMANRYNNIYHNDNEHNNTGCNNIKMEP